MSRWSRLPMVGLMVVGISLIATQTQAASTTGGLLQQTRALETTITTPGEPLVRPEQPIVPLIPAFFLIRNAGTGKCLDSDERGDVYTSPCTSHDDGQLWRPRDRWLNRTGVSKTLLVNAQSSRCLDSNGRGEVYTSGCLADDPGQHWTTKVWPTPDGKAIRTFQSEWSWLWLNGDHFGDVRTVEGYYATILQWHTPY